MELILGMFILCVNDDRTHACISIIYLTKNNIFSYFKLKNIYSMVSIFRVGHLIGARRCEIAKKMESPRAIHIHVEYLSIYPHRRRKLTIYAILKCSLKKKLCTVVS